MNLHVVPGFVQKAFPGFTWKIPEEEKKIYLTFDDGPIPDVTEKTLEILEKYQAKATFFCVGDNIRKHPQIFKQVLFAGHRIGNHTYHHLKGWNVADNVYLENIRLFESEATEKGYNFSGLFRPPYGRITLSQSKKLLPDYRIIMWDVLACDYDHALSPEKCLRNTIKHTKSGSIVLFHDSIKSERNLFHALPRFLAYFSDKGYRFVSL